MTRRSLFRHKYLTDVIQGVFKAEVNSFNLNMKAILHWFKERLLTFTRIFCKSMTYFNVEFENLLFFDLTCRFWSDHTAFNTLFKC